MKISAFFLAVCLAAGFPAMEVKAADDVLENIYEEHQYKTENPDSDEAEGLFEKELKRDGITSVSYTHLCWILKPEWLM